MVTWLKYGLIAIVLIASWAGAILYWRTGNHEPAAAELLLFLIGLPAMLIAALWFGSGLINRRSPAPAGATSVESVQAPPTSRPAPLAILAASLRLPHGSSPGMLAEAIARNKTNTDLDPDLIDGDGFPVMAARSDDAVDEALQEEIIEWMSHAGINVRFSDEQWRALALGSGVLRDLALHAVSSLIHPKAEPQPLQLMTSLPPHWQAEQRIATAKWFEHTLLQCGWPASRLSVIEPEQDSSDTCTAALLDQVASKSTNPDTRAATILLACASNIGQETVDRWASTSILFTASHLQGQVPGEGAAGMLLMAPPANEGAKQDVTLLHLSADMNDSRGPATLETLTKTVLVNAAANSGEIGMVVADTGMHGKSSSDLMKFTTAFLPHIDASTDVARMGAICGDSDGVPFIAALALAQHYACQRQGPVLAIGNADRRYSCAALVQKIDQPEAPISTEAEQTGQSA